MAMAVSKHSLVVNLKGVIKFILKKCFAIICKTLIIPRGVAHRCIFMDLNLRGRASKTIEELKLEASLNESTEVAKTQDKSLHYSCKSICCTMLGKRSFSLSFSSLRQSVLVCPIMDNA